MDLCSTQYLRQTQNLAGVGLPAIAINLIHRVKRIAGKPAPTVFESHHVLNNRNPLNTKGGSPPGRSNNGLVFNPISAADTKPCRSGLARDCGQPDTPR